MKKPKAQFRKNDVLMLEEQKKVANIVDKTYIQGKGYLYTLQVAGQEGEFKRYYESRINNECSKLKNDKAAKVLFGKTKKP